MQNLCYAIFPIILLAVIMPVQQTFGANDQVTISNGAGHTRGSCTPTSCFDPQVININFGDTVTWINADTIAHTATSGKPSDNVTGTVFDSSLIAAHRSFTSAAFNTSGTYNYFCQVHPWMTGEIIVGSPITVSTNKQSYNFGDTIMVSGKVQQIIANTPLTIIIKNPNANVIRVEEINVNPDGTFLFMQQIAGILWDKAGTYTLIALYGSPNTLTITTFSVNQSTKLSQTTPADDNVFNPPSIGNDFHNQYGGGITINGKPFDIKNYATTIPQQILQIGERAEFDFKIYDERGAYTVAHAGMYFHFKGDPSVNNANTWISWDKYKGFDVHDPDKIFSNASSIVSQEGNYFHITFTMTPQKPMPDSSLIMRMWDDKLALGDVPIWGAIVIVDPNAPVPVKKIPTDQYGDYVVLERLLDKDGYYIPKLLNKMHNLNSSNTSVDIDWVYDKGEDKLTMIEKDKSGNLIGSTVCDLVKKNPEPKVTARNYVDIPVQLDRWDPVQEETAKQQEALKAEKILESMRIRLHW